MEKLSRHHLSKAADLLNVRVMSEWCGNVMLVRKEDMGDTAPLKCKVFYQSPQPKVSDRAMQSERRLLCLKDTCRACAWTITTSWRVLSERDKMAGLLAKFEGTGGGFARFVSIITKASLPQNKYRM